MERRLKREKRMAERMNQMAEIEEAAKEGGGGGDRAITETGAEEEAADGEEPERQQAKRILEDLEDQVRTTSKIQCSPLTVTPSVPAKLSL